MAREAVFVSGVSESDDEFHGREYIEKPAPEKHEPKNGLGMFDLPKSFDIYGLQRIILK